MSNKFISVFIASGLCFWFSYNTSWGQDRLADQVNPFIGTGGHGHTFPGATLPFGMIQASPDTRLTGWDGCSGYHYTDTLLFGFSQTHLSGTGVSDYGDILIMPGTGPIVLNNGADGNPGYGAVFSKKTEKASPGYYSCDITGKGISAEVTVTARAAIYRFRFPENSNPHLILDLAHRDKVIRAGASFSSAREIRGCRISSAWAREQHVYFNMEFSLPVRKEEVVRSDNGLVLGLPFDLDGSRELLVKIAISAVDEKGAAENLNSEIIGWDFEQTHSLARKEWEKELRKILIETQNDSAKRIFYTALYHSMLAPNQYQDVDGRYRGMDLEIHQNDTTTRYTIFSLWDTYRATHPLLAYLQPERSLDFVRSMLGQYLEGGILPIWELAANYTGCMIGYHSIPVIWDLWQKGIRGFDPTLALQAMVHSATRDHLGLNSYKKVGFVSAAEEAESVSKTLEYAYDDWCIGKFANELGESGISDTFIKRSLAYQHLFDPETGFFRPRTEHTMIEPFDPAEVNFHYTEANAWQYNYYVPHDIKGLINLHGGEEDFEKKLDALFLAPAGTTGRDQPDISGMIGQYAHGNEPSHHIAYLYNSTRSPYKTQKYVREIIDQFYQDRPDGLSGNEDCGQMSSWYVFSALGFYPVTPGSNTFAISTPLFGSWELKLKDGKVFRMECEGCDSGKKYIASVTLNGRDLDRTYLTHDDIIHGGFLQITASDDPTDWGGEAIDQFSTAVNEDDFLPRPYFKTEHDVFRDSIWIRPGHAYRDAELFVKISGNEARFEKCTQPILLDQSSEICVYAKPGPKMTSDTVCRLFRKLPDNWQVKTLSEYAPQYAAGGNLALIDGVTGGQDFRTGGWQGYQGVDVEAVIDLGKTHSISELSLRCLQDQRSWILLPGKVEFFTSVDGRNFSLAGVITNQFSPRKEGTIIHEFSLDKDLGTRFIKIVAHNQGRLPSWHLGAGGDSWIFIDELVIKTE